MLHLNHRKQWNDKHGEKTTYGNSGHRRWSNTAIERFASYTIIILSNCIWFPSDPACWWCANGPRRLVKFLSKSSGSQSSQLLSTVRKKLRPNKVESARAPNGRQLTERLKRTGSWCNRFQRGFKASNCNYSPQMLGSRPAFNNFPRQANRWRQ